MTGTRSWFGQPPGLTILFLTETWEKFSFFGMRALLVYYMTKELLLAPDKASFIYGIYTAFVYLTPIFGGYVSDRWLGRRKSIIVGGTIMAFGHFMMVSHELFLPALATIAIGNGLFLPSIPSQIGSLYAADDPRRGSAYNVYYVGVNVGGFAAPFVCGTLGELYGWHWGFGAAGVGMVIGLLIYVLGGRYLPPDNKPAAGVLVDRWNVSLGAGVSSSFKLLAGIAMAVVIFRGAYEQLGNTIALWADTGVDRAVGDRFIPMTWFQALGPLIVFTLTPFLIAHWTRLARQGRDRASIVKMSIGAAVVSVAYLLVASVSYWCEMHGAKANWFWLAAFIALVTIGELYVLPIGLGLFGRLAPAHLAATTIAAWFLAAFAGNLLAGSLGALWSRMSHPGFFTLMAGVAGTAALLLRLFEAPVRRAEARLQVTASSERHVPSTAEGPEESGAQAAPQWRS